MYRIPHETCVETLERWYAERAAWIKFNRDVPIDCQYCGATHPIERLVAAGGCRGPALVTVVEHVKKPEPAKPARRVKPSLNFLASRISLGTPR